MKSRLTLLIQEVGCSEIQRQYSLPKTKCRQQAQITTHCIPLQHTATHRQHPTTHYDTLQHQTVLTSNNRVSSTSTNFNTLHSTATHCNILQLTDKSLQHTTTHQNTLQHQTVLTSNNRVSSASTNFNLKTPPRINGVRSVNRTIPPESVCCVVPLIPKTGVSISAVTSDTVTL